MGPTRVPDFHCLNKSGQISNLIILITSIKVLKGRLLNWRALEEKKFTDISVSKPVGTEVTLLCGLLVGGEDPILSFFSLTKFQPSINLWPRIVFFFGLGGKFKYRETEVSLGHRTHAVETDETTKHFYSKSLIHFWKRFGFSFLLQSFKFVHSSVISPYLSPSLQPPSSSLRPLHLTSIRLTPSLPQHSPFSVHHPPLSFPPHLTPSHP